MKIYNKTDFTITEISDELWNYWISINNPKKDRFSIVPPEPEYDPNTQYLIWDSGNWKIENIPVPPVRKVWMNSAYFWNEFSFQEQMLICNSSEPDIKSLVVTLTVWPGEIWSDDPRLQQGMGLIVAKGVLTFDRINNLLLPTGLIIP